MLAPHPEPEMPHRIRSVAASCFAALLGACTSAPAPFAARDLDFRAPDPHSGATIFSPLNLPPPNDVRTAAGLPGPAYWQPGADYDISATLDDTNKSITARATITYTNHSPDDLSYLWLHLEQNAFRPDSAGSLMRENEGRFGNRNPFIGGFTIGNVTVNGRAAKLLEYGTVGRIDLDTPLKAKGARATIDIEYSFNIPSYGADRMGIHDSPDGPIFEFAQWFPAMCVYDDVYGWNTLPYLGQGEFYTNVGSFNVALTVPRNHIVVATGLLQNPNDVLTPTQIDRLATARKSKDTVAIRTPEEVKDPASRPTGDGPLTWKFKADSVRTFAWASSKAFIWDAAGIDWGDGTGVLVQAAFGADAMPTWHENAVRDLRFATEHYSQKWFRYPYPSATNVNGVCGGMEYPMIIFCGARRDPRGLFGVTSHEIGHNWFPMTVSTDERRHAWMDEGFNTFINHYAAKEKFPDYTGGRGNPRELTGFMQQPRQQPMDIPADQVMDGRLGQLQYAKPAAALVLLRDYVLGPERFDPAFRQYISAWAFKSPRPADFFRCIENGAGADLSWFWRGWVYGTGTLDQAVERADYIDKRSLSAVTFLNLGELVMPLKYKVTYDDGTEEIRTAPVEAWFSTNRFTATLDKPGKRVKRIELDPDKMLPDTNLSNNVWPR